MPNHYRCLLIAVLLIGQLPCVRAEYKPTRESLSQYEVPEWYHDAKIGFFYHWGPGSVSGDRFDHESMEFCRRHKYQTPPGQYASHMYGLRGPDQVKDPLRVLHEQWYGPPEEFGYKDLIPLLTGAKWDPERIVELLDRAGVKYIVPMAIHHDGFAMWDSKVIDRFNAAKMGPRQNTTAQIIAAARNRGIRVGVSTHCARHSWYYTKKPEFDTGDPKYEQLYGEGLGKDGLPQPRAIQKWEDTLDELIQTFHPDYIFVDGGTADTYTQKKSYVMQDAFRRIVANFYDSSAKWGGEPVITFKRESLYKEEAVPDYEGGDLIETAPYKWQTHSSISGWLHRAGERAQPSFRLLGHNAKMFVVSKFEDAVVEFDFRFEEGDRTVVFVGNAPGRSHLFNLNLSPDKASLMRFQDKKVKGDNKEILKEVPVGLPAGQWHKVTVVMQGPAVTVSVNGEEIFSVSHERFVGHMHNPNFRTAGPAVLQLDNIIIRNRHRP